MTWRRRIVSLLCNFYCAYNSLPPFIWQVTVSGICHVFFHSCGKVACGINGYLPTALGSMTKETRLSSLHLYSLSKPVASRKKSEDSCRCLFSEHLQSENSGDYWGSSRVSASYVLCRTDKPACGSFAMLTLSHLT